jgi:hypothetical protein
MTFVTDFARVTGTLEVIEHAWSANRTGSPAVQLGGNAVNQALTALSVAYTVCCSETRAR